MFVGIIYWIFAAKGVITEGPLLEKTDA